jgi:sugar O-acyltransferase (sialic acid O-acetyltransferase NeuD family)
MKKLIIFPFNGNGIEALDCLGNDYELIAFADDTKEKQGISEFGVPVYGREVIGQYPEAYVLAVPGSPNTYKNRRSTIFSLNLPENRFAKVVHPGARIAKYSSIGFNCLISAGVVINNKARLGNHICILSNSVIHHDSVVGDFSLIGSLVLIAGHTTIGENCYVGSGTSIINGIEVGAGTLVGIGSNIIRSLPAGVKVAGNPAKILTG